MQVLPGIEYVDDTAPAHVYVLDDNGALTLIDTGLPDEGPKVLDYLKRTGRRPEAVRQIVLTHRHGDHAGALPVLVQATGATVYAHEAEADAIAEKAPVDVRLRDGDAVPVFEGLVALHTPGHTPGHICLHLPVRRVLFTGDALLNRGTLTGPVPQYTPDLARAHASLREKLAHLAFDTLCVAHGDVILKGADAQVRALLATLT